MKPKNLKRPIHPGEIPREEFLAPLKMSAQALAPELKVAVPRISDIVMAFLSFALHRAPVFSFCLQSSAFQPLQL
jgi:addiction module HigA family antidote